MPAVQRRKLPSPAVAEPPGEGGDVTHGRHLYALRLLFRQGASESGLDLGIQGVFQRGAQLGEGIGHEPGNRLRERGDLPDHDIHTVTVTHFGECDRPAFRVVVRQAQQPLDRVVDVGQCLHHVELVVGQPGTVRVVQAHTATLATDFPTFPSLSHPCSVVAVCDVISPPATRAHGAHPVSRRGGPSVFWPIHATESIRSLHASLIVARSISTSRAASWSCSSASIACSVRTPRSRTVSRGTNGMPKMP